MGADLCMCMIAHRIGTKIDREAAMRHIENLRVSDLQKIHGDHPFEDIDENDVQALTEVKDILASCLDGVLNNLDARDVTAYHICGFVCYFTGGMTWGDDPTDSYSDFNRMVSCGVLGEEVLYAAGFEWPPTGPDIFHITEEASLTDV